ncbi:MAG: glycerol kinase GlpK [Mediterranea sp.]|jgi:glycerol kinase|nr:glycerol kinase GlpK [Mediterranea sp.]
MKSKVIAIDQSTSATKAMLFTEQLQLLRRVNVEHRQYYPQPGWVEHDAEEIYRNTVAAIGKLMGQERGERDAAYSLTITNQRETVVVWNRLSSRPIYHAVVWQCLRGADICKALTKQGYGEMVQAKSGLLIDPYFSASGVKWILDNVEGARAQAEQGNLLMGTMDSWLIWKLTGGRVHATDYTNASRTLLFNIHTLQWDDDLLRLFTIPRAMMPRPLPCDSLFGETTVEGLFDTPIPIAGVLGDSHGALVGQMCFGAGLGKATYGTGSSVMMNIGEKAALAPQGLVTSVGFAALGRVFYAFEGNIHCTGATLKWLAEQLQLIGSPAETEALAAGVPDNGGVYFVPAFAGLGAPWWKPDAKAIVCGMTLGTTKQHFVRAALESIAYQVKDLADMMAHEAGVKLQELRVDGGPTKNHLLMQFQADMLGSAISLSDIEEASALGAVLMNGLARQVWSGFHELSALRNVVKHIEPKMPAAEVERLYAGWRRAVGIVISD